MADQQLMVAQGSGSSTPNNDFKKKRIQSLVGLLILVLIIVVGVTLLVQTRKEANQKNSQKTEQQSREDIKTQSGDNFDVTISAIFAAVDGSSDASKIKSQAEASNKKLGARVGSLYGSEVQKSFESAWTVYLNQSIEYGKALKAGDNDKKDSASYKLDTDFVNAFSSTMGNAKPPVSDVVVRSGLSFHVNNVKDLIQTHLTRKASNEEYLKETTKGHYAATFDLLVSEYARQMPDKFKKNIPSSESDKK